MQASRTIVDVIRVVLLLLAFASSPEPLEHLEDVVVEMTHQISLCVEDFLIELELSRQGVYDE